MEGGAVVGPRLTYDQLARLDQWTIELTPLRERPTDLLPLMRSVIAQHGKGEAHRLSADFFETLALYEWPLNVRELVATMRRALVYLPDGGKLLIDHLPKRMRGSTERDAAPAPVGPASAEPKAELPPVGTIPTRSELIALLAHYRGNVADVARHTARKRMQVYRWLDRHGLDATDYRRGSG